MTPAGHATWAAAVGEALPVDGLGAWTVENCSPAVDGAGWRSWTVALRSPDAIGEQGTVVVHLPTTGAEPVFVVPAGRDERGTVLVASFSHALDPTLAHVHDLDGAR